MAMDYSSLRAAALRDGEDEEAVTVDTRALIDKVLARYSGEWTTLRELIQNAADAQATTVSIKWETHPSTSVPLPSTANRSELLKHTIANHTLRRLVVQNNGQPFTKTDWGRLKRIAEGNPDETKIGAFGVGFYSVFADCEEPFVSSGSEAMAFYWKGNSLFTKKSHLPEDKCSPYTAFVLDYRNTTTPMPNLLSVSQFLATSLTFVALEKIEFWIDDHLILSLNKKTSPNVDLTLPRDLEARTKDNIMKVISVGRTSTQIDASYMNVVGWKPQAAASAAKASDSYGSSEVPSLRSFFARLTTTASNNSLLKTKQQAEESLAQTKITEDVTKLNSATIFLRATTASIKTHVSSSFSAELERATKKPPPKTTKISILTTSYDEAEASQSSSPANGAFAKATDVFASVLPNKKPGGRIFIGFPTMQTTGAGMHISAPSVIPTVEREAIDLNARWVRTWNVELLRAAGIIARIAFANEMGDLDSRIRRTSEPGKKISSEVVDKFMPEALHILKTFTFSDSTPSSQVGQIIEEAFWTCFKKATIEVYSSRGVLQTSQVRLGSTELSSFVDSIPIVPKDMMDAPFVKKLIDFGLISHITVTDVKEELEAKALSKTQAINFIKWAGKKSLTGEIDPGSRAALMDVAVATLSDESDKGEIVALGSISNYLSLAKIPANMPVPPTTVPFALIVNISASELEALGWEPLEIVPWLRFLIETTASRPEEESVTRSSKFAVSVLTVLSKNWDNMTMISRGTVLSLVQPTAMIPTKLGMRKPTESFFASVKLFDDLPVIQGCEKLKEKFLTSLGVRKTVDLETIFTRLLNASGEDGQKKWSHMELIKYLASVQNDIPSDDLRKLKESRICPAEAGPKGMEPTKATTKLYKVSELFEPKDSLRSLHLPIIQWPGPPGSFRASSPEARFLVVLGLRTFPSVPELVDMMSSSDQALRTSAMTYFIANHHSNRYAAFDLGDCRKPILPLQGSTKLVTPAACFTNEKASVLGFDILSRDLHDHANKFGVARDPPIAECVNRLLANPPQNQQSAVTLFSYFASRISELGESSLVKLRNATIVPVKRSTASEKSGAGLSFISPSRAYLGTSSTYGDIFDFVDFGQDGNAFLFKCGAKSEPTKVEVAYMACNEPARLLSVLQSPEKYLDLLKSLAEATSTLQRDKELWRKLKSCSCLLAYKELVAPSKGNGNDLDEDEAPIRQYQLAAANQIVVLDDIISYRLFKEHLICAPEEDVLETFYLKLGASRLSSIVQEDVRIGPHTARQQMAESLKKHVLERSKIFLYEYANYRRDAIKHDAKWLEKNLTVEVVRSVALRRSLQGHRQTHTERRSAAATYTNRSWILYVADDGKPDMYQVGQAICQMLLDRPNQQAYLFFEPFLTLDLYGLRSRGYNVDRILRAKAAEARIAEEERRKALEEEQRQIREREQNWAQQSQHDPTKTQQLPQAAEAARETPRSPKSSHPSMPGAWDSPEESTQDKAANRKSRGLFSNLSRRLGFDTQDDDKNDSRGHVEQFMGNNSANAGPSSGNDTSGGNGESQKDDGKVTNPAVVQQNLLNAVNATRAHGSDRVYSEPHVTEVKEQATYCDKKPAQNINFVAEASNGMKVFVAKDMSANPATFLSANLSAINSFASLLVEVGNVYSLAPKVLHIFYDEAGGTIAFNTGGSIFCNLRFFLQLHAAQVDVPNGAGKAEAATWWWVVLAHELAHNLVSTHNSDHSYYTESFIQQYMGKMMAKTTQWTQGAQQPARPMSETPSIPLDPPPAYR
ncbi:neutral zinc metallopeptidase [Trichoderma arundinaceum]|uniref:Neutral zinc metallopeptidase n=1 Tax=Trichoderma arundinaceum TaxID=490622 RepID=A0A395NTG3_TRIAR|nr:neutral zinc metallopeptidase [Trichoderma arundinaceum]